METPCISIAHQQGQAVEVTLGVLAILFSYDTPVAYSNARTGARGRTGEFFSVTTSKHITQYGAKEWPKPSDKHADFLHDLTIEVATAMDSDR